MSVVAPPERPRPDELEALIREARARQLRRRFALAAWVALAAAAVIGAHSLLAGNGRAVPSSGANGGSGLQPCRLSALAVREIPISNPTGLDRLGLQFTNRAGSSCQVAGYPAIRFRDATGTVPFLFRRLGTPRPITLPAHRSTFSIFSKFRCDIGVIRSATKTVVSVPGGSSTVVIPGGPSICKPGIAAEGRWVTLTPFESLQAAYRTSLIGNGTGP
jgi:Protein of unknown function (DUF4232)